MMLLRRARQMRSNPIAIEEGERNQPKKAEKWAIEVGMSDLSVRSR
jgi:hypothetical protein